MIFFVRVSPLYFLLATVLQAQPLVDRFFDEAYFKFHPSEATGAGFHQYDDKLEDYSPTARAAQIAALKHYRTEFANYQPVSDRELVLSAIDSSLLELETIRFWEKNPDRYSGGITASVFTLISRKFAPAEARLRSVIARERQMPAALAQGRANVKNPPRIYTEIALEQLPGMARFFEKDVPAAFAGVRDEKLLAEFRAANAAVIDALNDYGRFLKDDLLPRSKGDFRIGARNYSSKLLYDEMVDAPLEQLLEMGFLDLRRNQQAFREVAAKIDPKRPPQEVLHEIERDHPPADGLLQAFRDVLGGLREFIASHHIVTLPSPVPPILEETPPFMRALTSASMDTPGPYELVAKEAFFNVTLPEKTWSARQVEEHLASFNRGVIHSTAIHEAYPGHYTQFLWLKTSPSKIRKLLGASSNAEGWAHYCEQMMLDEGYGGGDLKLRLGQIQDALLRDARYIVGIQMHTGKMTFEQGANFFVNEGYQTRANAERETKRGTSDPTYLVYTLGKLQILKLREDYRKAKGAAFRLQEFHDSFLQQGFPPVKLVRRALLGDDGAAR